jgi:hypothetical protein
VTPLFDPSDLIDGTGMDKVFANLNSLRRVWLAKQQYGSAVSAAVSTKSPAISSAHSLAASHEVGPATPDLHEFRQQRMLSSERSKEADSMHTPPRAARRFSTPTHTARGLAFDVGSDSKPSTKASAAKGMLKRLFRRRPSSDVDKDADMHTPAKSVAVSVPPSPYIPSPGTPPAATHSQMSNESMYATPAADTTVSVPSWTEFAALYSGHVSRDSSPESRRWLWHYLVNHDAQCISPDVSGHRLRLLRTLVRAGIPDELRGRVWAYISGAVQRMEAAASNYYSTLLRDMSTGALNPNSNPDITKSLSQIEADLRRTMPNLFPFPALPSDLTTRTGDGETPVNSPPGALSTEALQSAGIGSGWPFSCLYLHTRPGEVPDPALHTARRSMATTSHTDNGRVYVAESAIRNVLLAWVAHCPVVGYCQVSAAK